jgi:hypothetical protein
MQFVATNGTLFAVQFGDRIAALENSEGLYQLYNHPHWIKFMELVCVARTTNGISRLREWACSHPQLLPLLHRFDQCTRKYGLTIDPFLFVPPSRLMYKKNCEKQLLMHQKQAAEHQRQALRYQEILRRLKVPSSSAHKRSPDKAATSTRSDGSPKSCFDVISEKSSSRGNSVAGAPEWDLPEPFVHSAPLPNPQFRLPPPATTNTNNVGGRPHRSDRNK